MQKAKININVLNFLSIKIFQNKELTNCLPCSSNQILVNIHNIYNIYRIKELQPQPFQSTSPLNHSPEDG